MTAKRTRSGLRAFKNTQSGVPLAERLVASGVITKRQLGMALRHKLSGEQSLEQALLDLGVISSGLLVQAMQAFDTADSANLAGVIPHAEAVEMLPKRVALRYSVLPLYYNNDEQVLTVAVTETLDVDAMSGIAAQVGREIEIRTQLADDTEIRAAIKRVYEHEITIAGILSEIDAAKDSAADPDDSVEGHENPLFRLAEAILTDALGRHATSVHFEPEKDFVRIRYRIDGVFCQVLSLHRDLWRKTSATLEVMANLPAATISASRHGRLLRVFSGRSISIHVFSEQTMHGDAFVLRLLDRRDGVLPLPELGIRDDTLSQLQLMLARPEGLTVVAGPPGSGKTSTLYSLLEYRRDESINIVTFENPPEYPVPLVRQTTQRWQSENMTCNHAASVLGQNADIVVFDELRDRQSAAAAVSAAMQGLQVFTTLNASSALMVLPRLAELGIEPESIAGCINGIVAQRLVRRLCRNCREAYAPGKAQRKILGLTESEVVRIYREGACERCDFIGYRGRIGVFEALIFNDDVVAMIGRNVSRQSPGQIADAFGFRPFRDDALQLVMEGTTSLAEISRVIDLTACLR